MLTRALLFQRGARQPTDNPAPTLSEQELTSAIRARLDAEGTVADGTAPS